MQVEVLKLPYHTLYTDTKVELIIPVAMPNLDEVRAFAYKLHTYKKSWRGDFQGWPAYYTPEDRSRKPPHSAQLFYPAEFWIGTDHVWTFTLAWEDGSAEEPIELESNYIKQAA